MYLKSYAGGWAGARMHRCRSRAVDKAEQWNSHFIRQQIVSVQRNTLAALFRNQTILLTIGSFLTGLFMFAGWETGGEPEPVYPWDNCRIAGIDDCRDMGPADIHRAPARRAVSTRRRYDKTSATIAVVTRAAATVIPILVITGALPGVSPEMTNAVFGFMAGIFWGQLISIWIWESDTGVQAAI